MERAGCNPPAASSSSPLQRKQKAVIPPRTIRRPSHNVSRYVEVDLPDTHLQRSCVRAVQPRPRTPQQHAPSLQLFSEGSQHVRSSPRRARDVVQDQGRRRQQQERTKTRFITVIDAREGRYEEIQNFMKPDTHKRDPPKRPEPPKRPPKPARPPLPMAKQNSTSSAPLEYDYVDINNPRGFILVNKTVRSASLPAGVHGQSEDQYMSLEQSMMSDDSVYAIPSEHVPPEHSSSSEDEDHDYTVPDDSIYYNFQDPSFRRDLDPGIYAPLIDQTIQDAPMYQKITPVHSATSSLPVQ